MKLNKYDYELLEFLHNNKYCSLNKILEKFPDNEYGTRYRLYLLTHTKKDELSPTEIMREELSNRINDFTYMNFIEITCKKNKNYFSLTSRGAKQLLEHNLYIKNEKKENFKKNITFYSQLIFTCIVAIANLILAIKS